MTKRRLDVTPPDKVREQLGRALEIAAKHKDREARIVRGLGVVQESLGAGNHKRASLAIDALMQTDLKESRKDVYDRDAALRIAIAALQKGTEAMGTDGGLGKELLIATNQVRMLVPDAFETPIVTAGTATA